MSKQADKTNKPAPPKAAKPKAPHIQPTPVDSHLLQLAREDPARLTPSQRTHLQRTLGNQRLQKLVGTPPAHHQPPIIQPKLTVNAVGDQYEQEADAVAKEVVQKLNAPQPNAATSVPTAPPTHAQRQTEEEEPIAQRIQRQTAPQSAVAGVLTVPPTLQRQSPEEEDLQLQRQETEDEELQLQRQALEEEEPQEMAMLQRDAAPEEEELQLQRQELPDEEEMQLQRQEVEEEDPAQLAMTQRQPQDFTHGGPVNSHIEAQINQSRGGGQPMEDSIRQPMEQAFGADFSDVRIHTDGQAHTLNEAIQARAFTTGNDIYFKEGEYSLGSLTRRELLAHELTHTLQQNTKNNCVTDITSKQVQRYDSFEHAQLGDSAARSEILDIQGVQITMGEINALGDFYAHPQDLRDANPNELKRLVELLRRQKADPESVSEGDWDKATKDRYTELAENNSAHFSPQNAKLVSPQQLTITSGEDNRSVWIEYHRQALALARHAAIREDGPIKQDVITEAKIVNSFADHYLSDAFSAGHLFNKGDVMALVERNLSQLTDHQLERLFSTVADNVFNEQSNIISQYELDIPGPIWPNLNPFWFKKLLEGIYEKRPTVVHNAIVKAAHDKLNTWPGGVPVENDYERWNLSGDDTLASSPQTQIWAQKAIEESRANLELAMEPRSITAEEFNGLVERVLTYFPRPTEESAEMIHTMLDNITNPNSQMATAISEVLSSQIGVVLEKIVAEGYVRRVETIEDRSMESELETLRKLFIEQDFTYVDWFIRNLSGV